MSASIEQRLQALEDRAEIAALIARYGPAVDSGDGDAVRALWTDEGTYVIDDVTLDAGGIRTLTELPTHQEYMSAGCAHVISAPRIQLTGDAAVATTHSVVMIHDGERWNAERVSANRWELARTVDGWRVSRRRNHLLNGAAAARALLTD
ncbi:nuclear transport factor 2 family protein [Microbacterium abyssi]|uniref:nuclear transport factor 2 family protein n=1 Tax=Microbacterium abyssi TaxID=2782166 RepID=UPI001887A904|nr:nuclear transport factor 2 family protein [Microbacterium sp. A18JL241]